MLIYYNKVGNSKNIPKRKKNNSIGLRYSCVTKRSMDSHNSRCQYACASCTFCIHLYMYVYMHVCKAPYVRDFNIAR